MAEEHHPADVESVSVLNEQQNTGQERGKTEINNNTAECDVNNTVDKNEEHKEQQNINNDNDYRNSDNNNGNVEMEEEKGDKTDSDADEKCNENSDSDHESDLNYSKIIANHEEYRHQRKEQFQSWQRDNKNRKNVLLKRARHVTNIRKIQQEITSIRHKCGADSVVKRRMRVVHFNDDVHTKQGQATTEVETSTGSSGINDWMLIHRSATSN